MTEYLQLNSYTMKTKLVSAILCIFSFVAYRQTEDSIASTLLVADYDYTCHTSNAQGEDVGVNYGLLYTAV